MIALQATKGPGIKIILLFLKVSLCMRYVYSLVPTLPGISSVTPILKVFHHDYKNVLASIAGNIFHNTSTDIGFVVYNVYSFI